MSLLRRTEKLPDQVRAVLPGVRPLVWNVLADGTTAVADRTALHLVPPAREGVARTATTLPWHQLEGAAWEDETDTLTVRETRGGSHRLVLTGSNYDLQRVVRERIEASLAHLAVRELPGGTTVRAAIRRDGDGNLSSEVTVVGAVGDEAVVARTAADLEREVRSAVGLPD